MLNDAAETSADSAKRSVHSETLLRFFSEILTKASGTFSAMDHVYSTEVVSICKQHVHRFLESGNDENASIAINKMQLSSGVNIPVFVEEAVGLPGARADEYVEEKDGSANLESFSKGRPSNDQGSLSTRTFNKGFKTYSRAASTEFVATSPRRASWAAASNRRTFSSAMEPFKRRGIRKSRTRRTRSLPLSNANMRGIPEAERNLPVFFSCPYCTLLPPQKLSCHIRQHIKFKHPDKVYTSELAMRKAAVGVRMKDASAVVKQGLPKTSPLCRTLTSPERHLIQNELKRFQSDIAGAGGRPSKNLGENKGKRSQHHAEREADRVAKEFFEYCKSKKRLKRRKDPALVRREIRSWCKSFLVGGVRGMKKPDWDLVQICRSQSVVQASITKAMNCPTSRI